MPQIVIYIPSILCVLVVLSFVLQNKARTVVRKVLLGAAALTVLNFYWIMLVQHPDSLIKMQNGVAATRAEVPLKFQSTFNVGLGKVWESIFPAKEEKQKRVIEVSTAGMNPVIKIAVNAFDDYLKESSDPPVTKAKLASVLSVNKKDSDGIARGHKLVEELSSSGVEREHQMGKALGAAYYDGAASTEQLKEYAKTLETTFPPGWFRDYSLLALYRSHDAVQYDKLATRLEESYSQAFFRFAAVMGIAVVGFFVGLVVLVIQIGTLARRDARQIAEEEKPQLALPLSSALVAFIAWQATEVVIGQLLRSLPPGALKQLAGQPLSLAIFLLVTYLINMGPALFYIYFLALKPNGLSFFHALKIRSKTAKAGPLRLILSGILSWCACIPLVALASFCASLTGSKGSDNPVLAQIVSASKGPDPLVIGLLFLTIAVLAPLCEEIIFRGFLYGILRRNCGTFLAVTGSALVFAAIHLDKGGMLMLFAIGLALALCYERNRSLVPCFIAHGMWNGGTLILNMILFS